MLQILLYSHAIGLFKDYFWPLKQQTVWHVFRKTLKEDQQHCDCCGFIDELEVNSMSEYSAYPQEKEQQGYLVHLVDCPSLEEVKTAKYLGSYSSPQAAFKKAKGFFDPVAYCPKCLAG